MKILSNKPVGLQELKNIIDIMHRSNCPAEGLKSTFPERFAGLTDCEILFDSPPRNRCINFEVKK